MTPRRSRWPFSFAGSSCSGEAGTALERVCVSRKCQSRPGEFESECSEKLQTQSSSSLGSGAGTNATFSRDTGRYGFWLRQNMKALGYCRGRSRNSLTKGVRGSRAIALWRSSACAPQRALARTTWQALRVHIHGRYQLTERADK